MRVEEKLRSVGNLGSIGTIPKLLKLLKLPKFLKLPLLILLRSLFVAPARHSLQAASALA